MDSAPRRRTLYAVAAVVLAAAALQLMAGFSGDAAVSETVAAVPAALSRARTAAPESPRAGAATTARASARLLVLARRTSTAKSADLFAAHAWYVAPPPAPAQPPPPPPEPTAPALPYGYLGSYTEADQQTVYYLTRADRVYDVHLGDALDDDYSLDAIENGTLVITYKPLNVQQRLPMQSDH